jgi:uncharacterized protein
MRVAIAGATGLIGAALTNSLRADGHTVHRLVRRANDAAASDVVWNPSANQFDASRLEGVDAIVNLSGERIDQRWTTSVKRAIRDSRVDSTALLARTAASLSSRPKAFVNASAIGVYGSRGDEELDESSTLGDDFLARVVRDWEAATSPASAAGIRVVLVRNGVVLAKDHGALARLLPTFRLGAGGRAGSGAQWLSWISLEDDVRALQAALRDTRFAGPMNFVAPNPVTNEEFAKTLGRVLGRPAMVHVPQFVFEMMFGEMARETILASQRVHPRALAATGFEFKHPTVAGALRAILGDGR